MLSSQTIAVDRLPSGFPGTGFRAKAAALRRELFESARAPYLWAKSCHVSILVSLLPDDT
jgi:hypothetical protein